MAEYCDRGHRMEGGVCHRCGQESRTYNVMGPSQTIKITSNRATIESDVIDIVKNAPKGIHIDAIVDALIQGRGHRKHQVSKNTVRDILRGKDGIRVHPYKKGHWILESNIKEDGTQQSFL